MTLALLVIYIDPASYLVKAIQGSTVKKKTLQVRYPMGLWLNVYIHLSHGHCRLSDGQPKYKHFNLSGNKVDSLAVFCFGCLCRQG